MRDISKIKVILADKDIAYQESLKNYLEQAGNVSVVAMTDTGAKTLAMMKKTKADVLIMDVLLGDCDGIWVLEEMRRAKMKSNVCIMISAINSDQVVGKAMKLGADYFMAKPVQSNILLERMEQLYINKLEIGVELMPSNHIHTEHTEELNSLNTFESLEGEISKLLNRMGIPASIKGFHYIRKAILMAVENEEALIGITKGLYPDIAKFYNTTSSKVERAIRHAIEASWKRNGEEVFVECSGYLPSGKPTNGQFIAVVSEYFRLTRNGIYRRPAS